MRFYIAAAVSLGLSSCNTTDALIPQEDISSVTSSSSPVTQADTERMARADSAVSYPTPAGSTRGYVSGPQNTLEAQARALEAGNATSPASSGPPPVWEAEGGSAAELPANEPPPSPAMQASRGPEQAAGETIRFLPIIGAPVQAVTPLSRQLGAEARAGGLTIRPSGDTSTQHILKGYFSAFSDSGKVTIIYVWDILDNSGARLHRMQGQEVVAGDAGDPWAAVPEDVMRSIASKTIHDYLAWRQSQAG
jgi:hypothetical protein